MQVASDLRSTFIASQDTDTHRTCSMCGELKPLDQFYKDGKDSQGNARYRRDCKECYGTTREQERAAKKRKKERGTK